MLVQRVLPGIAMAMITVAACAWTTSVHAQTSVIGRCDVVPGQPFLPVDPWKEGAWEVFPKPTPGAPPGSTEVCRYGTEGCGPVPGPPHAAGGGPGSAGELAPDVRLVVAAIHGSVALATAAVNGSYPWAAAWDSEPHAAREQSVSRCGAFGGTGCREISHSQEVCAALTNSRDRYWVGWGHTLDAAHAEALKGCADAGGTCLYSSAQCLQPG